VDLAAAEASGVGGDAVARLLGGGELEVPERMAVASPAALVPLGVPQLLIHGLRDTVVPPSMSERYAESALEAGDDVRYVPLPDAGHRDLIDPRGDAWAETEGQLETLFGRSGTP
jgi:pimeloyl-ACP methyl ester carboxylesterase